MNLYNYIIYSIKDISVALLPFSNPNESHVSQLELPHEMGYLGRIVIL